jgi:TonB family protein
MSAEDRRRRWTSLGLGSVAEALGLASLLALGTVLSTVVREPPAERVWSTRINLPSLPEPTPAPVKRVTAPPAPKIAPAKPQLEIPKPEVQTKPVLPPAVAAVHPVPRPPDLRRPVPQAELPKSAVPKWEPKVQVGAFAGGSSAPASLNLPARKVQTGGFGSPNGLPGEAQGGNPGNVPKLGSFDLPAGPGNGNGSGGAQGARGTVASAGFGNGIAGPGEGEGRPGRAAGSVQAGGFADAQAMTQAAPEARPREAASSYKPVEIIVKPNPLYTDEGRRLHIQGEVLLRVVFGASGQLRILGITQGLGHGLDEAAVRAAQQIQFKPAQRNGQPVDTAATLHILFQLAS